MKELMIHVEKAVRPLQISQLRRSRIREELLGHLTGLYEEELENGSDSKQAIASAIARFGPATEISGNLRRTLPWYAVVGSYIPLLAPSRSWPESTFRIMMRGWLTGILFWVIVGVPWCFVLYASGRRSVGEVAILWSLTAVQGLAMLVSWVGMIGATHGTYGQPKSKLRVCGFALAGGIGQLAVLVSFRILISPEMSDWTFILPVGCPIAIVLAMRFSVFTTAVVSDIERSARAEEWEQLCLIDE